MRIVFRIFVFFSLLTTAHVAAAENVTDSLKAAYRQAEPGARIDLALRIAQEERYTDMSSAQAYAQEALVLATRESDPRSIGKCYYTLGMLAAHQQIFDSVIWFQEQARAHFSKEADQADIARSLNESGIAFEAKGDLKKALLLYYQSLKIFQEIHDRKGIANEYTNIGLIFHYQENYNLAEIYFRRSLNLSESIGYEGGKANAWNNLGMNHQEKKEHAKALVYFRRLLEADLKEGNTRYIAGSYNNVGVALLGMKRYTEALDNLYRAAQLKEQNGDLQGLANTCNNIADALINTGRYDQAAQYLDKAMDIASRLQYRLNLEETYENYYKLFSFRKDYARALDYFRKFVSVRDSVYHVKNQSELARLSGEYETASRDKEIMAKNAEIDRRSIYVNFFGILIVAFIIVVVYLFIMLRNKQKIYRLLQNQQQEIQQQNTELKRINLEIVQAKENAEEAVKAKSQFLSVMSHEIRTPLNAIIGITTLLNANNSDPAQSENLNVLKVSSEHLLSLINDVLDLNKLESGKLELETIDFNLHSLLDNAREMFIPKANQKGIDLRLVTGRNVPAQLKGDPLRLNQVLTNLLSNALKFTEEGSITIQVQLLSRTRNNFSIEFSVTDTGIGIPQDKKDKIFETFTQADSATTRKYGGTGLGLSICRKLLNMVGSDLRLESEEGKGSRFSFILNFVLADKVADPASAHELDYSKLEGRKVLVAEDNNVNVYVLTQFLKRWNLQVDFAVNGKEAVDMLAKKRYDIVLMDVHMPVMDGLEATRIIRSEMKAVIPIIALTAASDEEMKRKVKERGMDDYVLKPFNPDELCEKMMNLLG